MIAVSLVLVLAGEIGAELSAGVVGELVAGLGALLGFGFAIGPVGGLATAVAVGLNSSMDTGLPFVVVALMVGLIFAANSPWPRYLFAAMLLTRRGDLPRRPAMFMDWAYQAGLMRLSGIAVQFRHREFQTWLATRGQPENSPQPRLSTTGTAVASTRNKKAFQKHITESAETSRGGV
jgi:hypothetical protein